MTSTMKRIHAGRYEDGTYGIRGITKGGGFNEGRYERWDTFELSREENNDGLKADRRDEESAARAELAAIREQGDDPGRRRSSPYPSMNLRPSTNEAVAG